jgi:hypothetical protein
VQVQVLWVDVRSLLWLTDQLFHFQHFPFIPAPIPVEPRHVLPVSSGTEDNHRQVCSLFGSYSAPYMVFFFFIFLLPSKHNYPYDSKVLKSIMFTSRRHVSTNTDNTRHNKVSTQWDPTSFNSGYYKIYV